MPPCPGHQTIANHFLPFILNCSTHSISLHLFFASPNKKLLTSIRRTPSWWTPERWRHRRIRSRWNARCEAKAANCSKQKSKSSTTALIWLFLDQPRKVLCLEFCFYFNQKKFEINPSNHIVVWIRWNAAAGALRQPAGHREAVERQRRGRFWWEENFGLRQKLEKRCRQWIQRVHDWHKKCRLCESKSGYRRTWR